MPHDVIYRKKVGFAAPITRWFKEGNYFRPYFKELMNRKRSSNNLLNQQEIQIMLARTEAGQVDHAVHLWVLQNVLAHELI